MRKILLTLFTFFSCSNTNVPKPPNELTVASFHSLFTTEETKKIQDNIKLKVKIIELSQKDDIVKQIKTKKPDLLLLPNNFFQKLNEKNILTETNVNKKFFGSLTSPSMNLYNLVTEQHPIKPIPLFISDIKIFSSSTLEKQGEGISFKNLLDNSELTITIPDNPRLIIWLAMCYASENKTPNYVANPKLAIAKEAIEKFFKTKSKKIFLTYNQVIDKWSSSDVVIGPNWLNGRNENIKKAYMINNLNVISMHGLFKTKYAKENSEKFISYIFNNYSKSAFSTRYIPISELDSKNQYNVVLPDLRESMHLSSEYNYYSFFKPKEELESLKKWISKKFL